MTWNRLAASMAIVALSGCGSAVKADSDGGDEDGTDAPDVALDTSGDGTDVPVDSGSDPGPDTGMDPADVPVDVGDPDPDATCAPGTGDCNGDPGDGCETDLTSDPAHCGACWHGSSKGFTVRCGRPTLSCA